MKAQSSASITTYDGAGRDSPLLRWSLWIAEGRGCYLCGDQKPFREVQLDHIIPKSLGPVEFSAVWHRVAGNLPDEGPHHISNLRACCTGCNSARLKGNRILADGVLSAYLARSPRTTEAALAEQKRLRNNREIAEAVVRMTAASSNEDFKLLWDTELSQALLGTLHVAADGPQEDAEWERRGFLNDPYLVRNLLTQDRVRFLGAIQLVSGIDLETLIDAIMRGATSQFDEVLSEYIEDRYPALRGPVSSPVDWSNAQFTIEWGGGTIDDETCTCDAFVVLDSIVSHKVAIQSPDGSRLIEIDSPELNIAGHLLVTATIEHGAVVDVSVDDGHADVNDWDEEYDEAELSLG